MSMFLQEHQELLQEVVQHEEKMIKREAHLHRVTTGMFKKVTPQEKEVCVFTLSFF